MITGIQNGTCYAIWQDGITQNWKEVADEIIAAWQIMPFNFVSIFGIISYVGTQGDLYDFIWTLTNEWEPINANN